MRKRILHLHGLWRATRREKQDDGLDALVLKLYEFSMSYPWPEQWLEECRAAYQIDSPEAVQKSIWVQELMS
ncbi:MAG: hypothetical protein V8R97_07085 [Fusicatenibacter saccharivorans]